MDEVSRTKEEIGNTLSQKLIISKNTFFPFDLFPDTVAMDRTKITITKRNFFMDEEVRTLKIDEVKDVLLNLGPVFGTITISFGVNNNIEIRYFKRSDAVELKDVIEGYLVALKSKIDLESVSSVELSKILKDLSNKQQNI